MNPKKRWKRTATVRWDDFFAAKVPPWLRLKRFFGKPRVESTYQEDVRRSKLSKTYKDTGLEP